MLENYWQKNIAYNHSHRNHFDYLGWPDISRHLVFVLDTDLKINQQDIEHDVDLIRNCKKESGRLPVLTLDSNPYNVNDYVVKLLQHLEPTDFFIFHSDVRPEISTHSNVAPWPSWLCNQQLTFNHQLSRPKRFRISYLSGVARYHRLRLFREIKPYIRESDVVVINRFCESHFLNTVPYNLRSSFDSSGWFDDLPWQSQPGLIDTEQKLDNANNQNHNSHPAYAACVNITGETAGHITDQVLISEKTWKAYMSGCLVINFGVKQMPETLMNMGLEIWSEYDRCENLGDKIQRIIELCKRDDIFEVYQQKREMIRYNQNLVCSPMFTKELAMTAIKKLERIL